MASHVGIYFGKPFEGIAANAPQATLISPSTIDNGGSTPTRSMADVGPFGGLASRPSCSKPHISSLLVFEVRRSSVPVVSVEMGNADNVLPVHPSRIHTFISIRHCDKASLPVLTTWIHTAFRRSRRSAPAIRLLPGKLFMLQIPSLSK